MERSNRIGRDARLDPDTEYYSLRQNIIGKANLTLEFAIASCFLDLFENPKDSLFLRKQKALNFQMSQKFERIFF